MDPYRAIELVKNVSYKPSWLLMPRVVDEDVVLEIGYVERDSDSMWAPNYERPTFNELPFRLNVRSIHSVDELYRKVLNCLVECEKHEAREFFKVGRSFETPFHPHRPDGNRLWETTTWVPTPEIDRPLLGV